MKTALRIVSRYFFILVGILCVLIMGLRFIGGLSVTELRFSTQFSADMKDLSTKPYLLDDFDRYQETQKVDLAGLNDLSAYSSKGMIIAWADVEDYSKIKSIDLLFSDDSTSHSIKGIDNKPELYRTMNGLWTDDEFVDYEFNCNQENSVWRDWMLQDGENMVFWEWNTPIPVDMKAVKISTSYPVRDACILHGFCKYETPTGGTWIPPHGLIQYGFHCIEDGSLLMKNVRSTQMVTNGDHTRVISNTKGTPRDFIMRVWFTPENLPETPVSNDYIRLAWDFEPEWDAGHDQTLVYISCEYGYLGMQRVYPVIRQKEQGYENSPKASFKLKNNQEYEISVEVRGQTARAAIYERKFGLNWKKASVTYTFTTPRPAESYPFSIEATGNPNLKVDLFEVREIIE